MDPSWFFEPFSPNGGTPAHGFGRLLSGTGSDFPQKFAREAIQNSCDAVADAKLPVRVSLRYRSLSGNARASFLQRLHLSGAEFSGRMALSSISDPLPLLYVEDFNTLGLGGAERSDEPSPDKVDRFIGLCRNLADSQKTEGGGGSFGVGKLVYWTASSLGTVLFYSRFRKSPLNQALGARFIGVSLFHSHTWHSRKYTGRAWFGEVDSDYCAPLQDGAADEFANQLGFLPRTNAARPGTSILIVGSRFTGKGGLEDLRRGITLNYWPRLADKLLSVDIDNDGELIDPPDPKQVAVLSSFVDCYNALKSGSDADGDPTVKSIRHYHRPLGRLALTAKVPEEEPDPTGSTESGIIPGVALLRKPKMVVEYFSPSFRIPCSGYSGVFLADDSMNEALARSEPTTHHKWDPAAEGLSAEESKLITKIIKDLKEEILAFARHDPKETEETTPTCPDLGRELARILSVPGSTGIGRAATPFSIDYLVAPHWEVADGAAGFLSAKVRITIASKEERLKIDRAAGDKKAVEVRILPRIVTSEGVSGSTLPVQFQGFSPKDGRVKGIQGGMKFPLSDGESTWVLSFRVGPREHEDQTVRVDLEAGLH